MSLTVKSQPGKAKILLFGISSSNIPIALQYDSIVLYFVCHYFRLLTNHTVFKVVILNLSQLQHVAMVSPTVLIVRSYVTYLRRLDDDELSDLWLF